jgi:hypothetical protein
VAVLVSRELVGSAFPDTLDVLVHAPMFPVVSAASLVMAAAAVGATRTLDVLVHTPMFSRRLRCPRLPPFSTPNEKKAMEKQTAQKTTLTYIFCL